MQIRCNTCMYSQTFFPSAVRLWNCVPSETCYLTPDSFKLELSKINLIWSRTMFLSHRTARFYFRKLAQHTIPQHMNSTRSAILLYIELALVLEDEDEVNLITVRLYRTVSEINGDFGRKLPISNPVHSTSPCTKGVLLPLGILWRRWAQKLEWSHTAASESVTICTFV